MLLLSAFFRGMFYITSINNKSLIDLYQITEQHRIFGTYKFIMKRMYITCQSIRKNLFKHKNVDITEWIISLKVK